jgi:hypothetical protein
VKSPVALDIPPRAAVTVVALVLLASVVVGGEDPSASSAPAEPARPQASAPPSPGESNPEADAADLDLEKLARPRRGAKIGDLFAPRLAAPLPVVAPSAIVNPEPVAPPAPTAPPLPFKYLGKLVDKGKLVVFLMRNDEPHSVEQGQTIDNTYKVDEVTESVVTFIYLPLGNQQTLPIPPQPRE